MTIKTTITGTVKKNELDHPIYQRQNTSTSTTSASENDIETDVESSPVSLIGSEQLEIENPFQEWFSNHSRSFLRPASTEQNSNHRSRRRMTHCESPYQNNLGMNCELLDQPPCSLAFNSLSSSSSTVDALYMNNNNAPTDCSLFPHSEEVAFRRPSNSSFDVTDSENEADIFHLGNNYTANTTLNEFGYLQNGRSASRSAQPDRVRAIELARTSFRCDDLECLLQSNCDLPPPLLKREQAQLYVHHERIECTCESCGKTDYISIAY